MSSTISFFSNDTKAKQTRRHGLNMDSFLASGQKNKSYPYRGVRGGDWGPHFFLDFSNFQVCFRPVILLSKKLSYIA